MSNRFLGLEIGNTYVAGVVLISGIKRSVLEAQARVPLAGPQDYGGNLSVALETLAETINIVGTTCAVSLPSGVVSFRNVRLPFRDKKKLHQVLPYELELQLPQAVEDIIIDHYDTNPHKHDGSELVAAAAPKSTLASLLKVLQSCRIDPVTITAGGLATALCIKEALDQPGSWILTDIEGDALSFFFADNDALKMMRAAHLVNPGDGLDATAIHQQIRHSLLAFKDMGYPEFKPAALYTTNHDLLHSYLNQGPGTEMGIPLKQTDLAAELNIEKEHPHDQLTAGALSENALALAYQELNGIKGLNFRKGPFERKKQWVAHRKSIVKTGLIAILVLLLAFANLSLETYLLDQKVSRLNQEIEKTFKSTLPDVTRLVDPVQQLRVKIMDAQRNLLPSAQDKLKLRSIDILKTLSAGIPQKADVELTRVVISKESVLINGNTDTFNAVDDIQTHLKKATVFQQVTISSANLDKSSSRINFKIKVTL